MRLLIFTFSILLFCTTAYAARDFDGSTDKINWANVYDLNNPHTMAYWHNSDDTSSHKYVFVTHESGDSAWSMFNWHEGGDGLQHNKGHDSRVNQPRRWASSQFSNGNWYHVAADWDGTAGNSDNMTLHVDGSSVSDGNVNEGTTPDPGDGGHVFGGLDYSDTNRYNGQAGEWAIWDRELTTREIEQMADGFSPEVILDGLVLYAPGIREQRDIVGGSAGTLDGTTVVDHPRRIY